MKIIVGLGNPGKEYEKTRHNIGFRVVDEAVSPRPDWPTSAKFNAIIFEPINSFPIPYIFIKPQTFMNLSGKSVAEFVQFYKLDPKKDLLVISDDKDMVFGKIRERSSGTSGGHKGLQSIIDHLGTDAFHRIKIGVGHEDQRMSTDAFVLQKFTAEEEKALPDIIAKSVELIRQWIR